MPSPAFTSALPFVLRWEGGFVDHPADPGGRTNKGVTQRVYDAWRVRQGLPAQDVKAIADAEVHAIYEADYWIPPVCDRLATPVDLVQFDTAVNMGVGRAIRFLQSAAGCAVDGDFGPASAKAVAACNSKSLVATYCNVRESFYRRLVEKKPELGVFLKGWLNRLNALRTQALHPDLEADVPLDFGAAGYIMKIPETADYDP